MPEPRRVRDPISGHEYTPTAGQLLVSRLTDDDVIDKAALAPSGDVAPVLYRTPLGTPRPGTKAAQRREKNSRSKTARAESGGAESTEPTEED